MKTLFTFFIVLTMVSCASQKINDTIDSVTYEAMTRGRSKNISLEGKNVTLKTQQETKGYEISSDDRKELVKIIDKIELKNIENLIAPTQKRLHDGAMHATVIITKEGKQYTSATFDDGFPPSELKELVELLEKLTEE